MEQVRSFIAIELPQEVKTCLSDLERELKRGRHSAIKWVSPEGIHLTLKFMGNVETDKHDAVVKAIREAGEGIVSFHLELGELGAFPNFGRPRVAWVGLKGALDRLIALQKRLDSLLSPLGFPAEERPFSPHLTLSRVRDDISVTDRQNFGQLLQKTKFEGGCGFLVESVNIMQSQLTPAGAIYTRLDSVPLLKG
ncbi:MAG: RNA 2',3'-cyclic phosphodiesterase [Dehalococcoidia bacterium]|nr:RNA 2',3'-cyclic phosphodiesterase [Dehalococcoidia bacterium]